MLLSYDNPLYNTIIVFLIIILLLYILKPDIIYDRNTNKFRQFGTTDGKTLLPIYVIAILLAIILYIFFQYVTNSHKPNYTEHKSTYTDHPTYYDMQNQHIQQINQLQQQIQQLMQQQLIQQLNQHHIFNNNTNASGSTMLPTMFPTMLPNNLSVR